MKLSVTESRNKRILECVLEMKRRSKLPDSFMKVACLESIQDMQAGAKSKKHQQYLDLYVKDTMAELNSL